MRNRLIEYFQLTSSFSEQVRYAEAVPFVNVPYEVINEWEDWLPYGPRGSTQSGVYTDEERHALEEFHAVWDAIADAVPDDYPTLEKVQRMPEWERLRQQAEAALGIFLRRGKLSEDHEEA